MIIRSMFMAGLSLLFVAGPVCAEIYMCTDASGRTLTSDRLIPECNDRKLRVFGNNGVVKKEIAPPLTAEEKRQKQREEEKRKVVLAAEEEQKRQDKALLARFKNENDIENTRKRNLVQMQDDIKREEASIVQAQKRLKEARTEAETYKKPKAPPSNVLRKIEDSEQSIADSKKQISEREAETAQINAKYDQYLARFRELTGAKQAAKSDTR